MLADAALGPLVWKAIAHQMGPQALRMNLNTLLRHEVFSVWFAYSVSGHANLAERDGYTDQELVDYVAGRIADAGEIRRSRQFPYQFLAACLNADETVPQKIKAALHQAAENACGNVPELPGPVLIGLDTSSVEPAPNSSRLLVVVTSDLPAEQYDWQWIMERLRKQAGCLRSEVAASINRKKIPLLAFHLLGPS